MSKKSKERLTFNTYVCIIVFMRKGITIKEIAAELEMDYSSVSRILNQDFKRHKFKKETIEKVVALASKRGLMKNHAAATLKSGRAKLIGISVTNIGFPFFAQLTAALERRLTEIGYRVIIANTDDSAEAEARNIADFLGYQVDGMIICPFKYSKMIAELGTPMVVVDNDIYPSKAFTGLNGITTGVRLGKIALSKGYGKIGVLCSHVGRERIDGMFGAITSGGVGYTAPDDIASEKMVESQVDYFLDNGCDAILSPNGICTVSLLDVLRKREMKIGSEIGVAGIDELPFAKYFDPPLTTMEQPLEKYADKALELLMSQIEKNEVDLQRHLFSGISRERESL